MRVASDFTQIYLTRLRQPVSLCNMTDVLVTGMALKLERTARNVKQSALAARMGVSADKVSRLENRYAVDPDMARQYRKALATFPSLASPAEPQEAA